MLAVVRLLAVYVAAAGASLFVAHRYIAPLRRRTAFFLALAPFLVTGQAMFSGGVFAPVDISYQTDPLASERALLGIGEPKNPVLGDVVYQEIPWRMAVRDAIRNGRAPLWNRFLLAGEPLMAMMQPAVLHPFTWAGMVLPLAQAWTLEMTLGVFLALLSAFLFFRDLSLTATASAIGATGWAFCDYLRFHSGYPLSPAAAAFPLLLLGLRRIALFRDRRSVAITIAALFLIVNAGHPESALHAVAGGGVWFLFCLAREPRRNRLTAAGLSLVAGLLTLGLTAVVLLPHVEALRQTFEYWLRAGWWVHQKKSLPLGQALATFQQILMPYSGGLPGHGRMQEGAQYSQAYVGAVLLPLAALGLISRPREKWPLLVMGVLGFGAWSHLPLITDGIAALPLFDLAVNERMVFLGGFALAGLAAFGVDDVLQGRRRGALVLCALAALLALSGGFLAIRGRLLALGMPARYADAQLALQVIPLAVAAALLAFAGGNERRIRRVGAAVLCVFLLERAAETEYLYPTIPARAFYPPLDLLKAIPAGAPYRMAALGLAFIPNVSTLYGVEDVRGYEAMTSKPLYETFPLWCVPQSVWFNRIDDPTRPFLSFLNMRYVLAPPGILPPAGWPTLASTAAGSLFENPRVLPRAFVPVELFFARGHERQLDLLGSVSDYGRRGVVGGEDAGPQSGWVPNGEARVAIASYAAGRLALSVEAKQPALVATSMVNWAGWRVLLDEKPAPVLEYNRAFVSFRVGPGSHRVEMLYLPRTVVIGATISAFTTGTLVALALAGSRRRRLREFVSALERP